MEGNHCFGSDVDWRKARKNGDGMVPARCVRFARHQETDFTEQYSTATSAAATVLSSWCYAQGPDWSGAGLNHQPAHARHQHSITLFTARLQQRRPLPTSAANWWPCILCRRTSCMESPTDRTETHAVVDSNIQTRDVFKGGGAMGAMAPPFGWTVLFFFNCNCVL